MHSQTAVFHVGSLPIYGDTILSPMARYSDVPYRTICRVFGSAMNYTEFVPANALLQPPNPMWRRLDTKIGEEYPMVFQIFGSDPKEMLKAAQRIEDWGADIIDINMGCSSSQVNEKGAGVAMMRSPKLVAETFSLLTRHLRLPVTGKIRLGWDMQSKNYLEIGRIMEDNGAALVAVHGRTRSQKYTGKADWDAIARLKQTVSIPVIGNGDVKSTADIDAMKQYTKCDGVMIGRAAVGNPWIFARRERETLTFRELTAVIRLHFNEMIAYYGTEQGLHGFRRHLKRYFSGLALKRFMKPMLAATEPSVFWEWLDVVETAVPAHETLAELQKRTWFPMPKDKPLLRHSQNFT
jgi:nifR3 family TIM-barrel protein